MMAFTDQKPRIATEEDLKAPWGGKTDGSNFRCGFCGMSFEVGDYWRWVYTNNSRVLGTHGNPLVCKDCDSDNHDELIEKLADIYEEFMHPKFWRLQRALQISEGK